MPSDACKEADDVRLGNKPQDFLLRKLKVVIKLRWDSAAISAEFTNSGKILFNDSKWNCLLLENEFVICTKKVIESNLGSCSDGHPQA